MYTIETLFQNPSTMAGMADVLIELDLAADPSVSEIRETFDRLPATIQALALEWGCDTVFRDMAFVYLKDGRDETQVMTISRARFNALPYWDPFEPAAYGDVARSADGLMKLYFRQMDRWITYDLEIEP